MVFLGPRDNPIEAIKIKVKHRFSKNLPLILYREKRPNFSPKFPNPFS